MTAPPDRSPRRWSRRLVIDVAALVTVGVAVAAMIQARLGVAPYDVLVTGVAEVSNTSVGVAAIAVATAFALAGRLLGGRIGIGTLLALVVVGPVLNLAIEVIPEPDAMAARIALFVAGSLGTAVGITGVIVSEAGAGPIELFMLALHEGRKLALAPVRTGIEVFCVGVGWLIGGQVGVGTVVYAVLIGALLRRTLARAGYRSEAAGGSGLGEPVDFDDDRG